MRTDALRAGKTGSPSRYRSFKVGDRVSFAGAVLRVLGDKLLILIEANGSKLIIGKEHFKGKLNGGDPVTLIGTVTRVGSSLVDELSPISLAVDGYTAVRVTLAKKSLRKS